MDEAEMESGSQQQDNNRDEVKTPPPSPNWATGEIDWASDGGSAMEAELV